MKITNIILNIIHNLLLADLLLWEEWLRGFCIGFLIFGGVVVLVVFITMGINVGHSLSHDFDYDADISVDKDISIDKDLSIDKDISVDKDFSIDKDVSIDKDLSVDKDLSLDHDISADTLDHETGPFQMDDSSAAPLMLILAVFSITFGGLGLLLFWQQPNLNSYIRLAIIIVSPFILSLIVDLIWRRVAKSESYRLPTNKDFVGREAVVSHKVDFKGGLIRVEIPDQLEPLKVPAKSLFKEQVFLPDELVFIVSVEGNYYLVNDEPNTKTKDENRVN